jgi:hypothetical protein
MLTHRVFIVVLSVTITNVIVLSVVVPAIVTLSLSRKLNH